MTLRDAALGDALALRRQLHAQPEFRRKLAELRHLRPSIAAGLPMGARPSDFGQHVLDTTVGPVQVLGTPADVRAAAKYRSELERLAAVLEPYVLWTADDLEQMVARWDEGLGAQLRAHESGGLAGLVPVVAGDVRGDFTSKAGPTDRKPRHKTGPTIEHVARAVALIACGNKPTDADAWADPLATDGGAAVRQARSRWCRRLAAARQPSASRAG